MFLIDQIFDTPMFLISPSTKVFPMIPFCVKCLQGWEFSWATQCHNTLCKKGQFYKRIRERSGSVVEYLTQDREAAGSSLTGATALWSLSKTHPNLVLVQPRKTHPCITERLVMGCNKQNNYQEKDQVKIFGSYNITLLYPNRYSYELRYKKLDLTFRRINKEIIIVFTCTLVLDLQP